MKQVKSTAISVFALALALMWLAPLVWLVGTAFSEPTFHMTFLPNSRFTFGNLSYVWNAIPFARYYLNTLILVVVTFCVQFVTSTLAAYALAVMDFKGQTDTKVGIMLPFFGSALAIFLLRQHFKSIPKALAEAARIDGANTWQTIWRVYMPCAKPAYMSFAVISVSYHWNNYLWPLIVTNSPSNRTLTVGLAIFAKSKEANMQWANVCAATFIIILPLLIAFFFLQKQFMNSFVSAGIKE